MNENRLALGLCLRTTGLALVLATAGWTVTSRVIDLTQQSKTPEPATAAVCVGFGGIYDAPKPRPGTPNVSVRLVRVLQRKVGKTTTEAVEVEVTNRGDEDIFLPADPDERTALAPEHGGRKFVSIRVTAEGARPIIVAIGRAATNTARPVTVQLHTGESATYVVPFETYGVGLARANSAGAPLQLAGALSLWRIDSSKENCEIAVGDEVKSENSLAWR